MKRWSFDTLPFIPQTFKYEVIPAVQKQFDIVKGILNRADVDTIYVCTDSGREGEYIYTGGLIPRQKKRFLKVLIPLKIRYQNMII